MRINLTVIKGPHQGRRFSFEEHDNFIVGRAKFAHFRLPLQDKFFSRIHFMVEVNPPLCRLLDMGSTNGTSVNGQKVTTAGLNNGDLIEAGKTVIRITLQEVESRGSDESLVSESPPPSIGFEHQALVMPTFDPPAAPRPQVDLTVIPSIVGAEARVCRVCEAPFYSLSSLGSTDFAAPLPLCPACRSKIESHTQPIAGYQIVSELGSGGMGVVYLALREANGELVALKTILPAIAGMKNEAERFLREARILGDLNHPNIVALREMGETNGLFYFAMDFVCGSDVAVLQKKVGGPLPIPRAVDLTCQLLSALEFAHGKGFVHRDIKPANMLVEERDGNDFVRLTDFGLARTYQTSPMSGLTMQGSVGGTVAFMAPEQITHFREAKPPADQYAAGATLYKLLTDRLPFDLPREFEKQLVMILQGEQVPIRKRRPEIPEALADIVHQSLAKDPKNRFKTVGAMRTALESFGRNR